MADIKYKNKHFFVKESKIPGAGMGLFANREFSKGEELGIYKGKLLTIEECDRYENWDHMLDITDRHPYVSLYPAKNMLLRYINHSPAKIKGFQVPHHKSPNVKFAEFDSPPFVKIIATKDIARNQEIYLNYGSFYTNLFLRNNEKLLNYYISG